MARHGRVRQTVCGERGHPAVELDWEDERETVPEKAPTGLATHQPRLEQGSPPWARGGFRRAASG